MLIFTSCKDDSSPVVIPPVSPNPDGLLVEYKVLPNGDLEALKDGCDWYIEQLKKKEENTNVS